MNSLTVGADKTPTLDEIDFSSDILFIDDGPPIDALTIPPRRKVTRFDVAKRARDFIAVIDAVFPEGDSTLTKKNANFVLMSALLEEPTYLHELLKPDKKDPAKRTRIRKYKRSYSPRSSPAFCASRRTFPSRELCWRGRTEPR